MNTPGLFGRPRRHVGRSESAVNRQLHAWRAAGHLCDDDTAGYRRVLRSLAERADRADADADAGVASQLSAARVHTMLLDALQLLAPAGPPQHTDALDAALADLLADAPTGDS